MSPCEQELVQRVALRARRRIESLRGACYVTPSKAIAGNEYETGVLQPEDVEVLAGVRYVGEETMICLNIVYR